MQALTAGARKNVVFWIRSGDSTAWSGEVEVLERPEMLGIHAAEVREHSGYPYTSGCLWRLEARYWPKAVFAELMEIGPRRLPYD